MTRARPRRATRRRLAAVAAAAVVLAACEIPYDFDGTGGADFVYLDSAGIWHDLDLPDPIWTPPAGDWVPVPGDYDGDGRWEPATVDRTTGLWTTAGTRGSFAAAMPPDTDGDPSTSVIPVPGDYDGDGDTDPAWFSESSATWLIDGGTAFVFGRPATDPATPIVSGSRFHDLAAPADYDGDGDTDPAVYRVETGVVHILGGATVPTGVPYGFPVPANYTPAPGDEAAVAGHAGQGWSVEGVPTDAFASGVTAATPVPADYDGDGTTERAYTVGSTAATWVVDGGTTRSFPQSGFQVALTSPTVRVNTLFVTFVSQVCVVQASPSCPS